MSMDGGGTGYAFQSDGDFPTDITILSGVVEIQSEKFKHLTLDDNIYTHHFLIYDMDKPQQPNFACEGGAAIKYVPVPSSVVLGGAAEDAESRYTITKEVAGKKTGYYVKKESRLLMNVDIVNYNKEDMDIYASADISYIPGQPADYLDVNPIFVPLAACDAGNMLPGIVKVPKGQKTWSLQSKGIVVAQDSILFLFRGHMHDGGSNIDVKINDKLVCDSKALYGGPGHVGKLADGKNWETISDMVTCSDGILVKKGDKVALSAHYDVVVHPP
jgi:hypothetical protein